MISKMLKQYAFVAVATAAIALIFMATGKERAALSCLLGGTLATLVQYFSITLSKAVFEKNSVAIALGVIVFKYAIFGIILWLALSSIALDPMGFFAGFLSLIPGLYFVGVVELGHRQRDVRIV